MLHIISLHRKLDNHKSALFSGNDIDPFQSVGRGKKNTFILNLSLYIITPLAGLMQVVDFTEKTLYEVYHSLIWRSDELDAGVLRHLARSPKVLAFKGLPRAANKAIPSIIK